MADRLANVDFTQFAGKIDRVFRAIERLGGMLAGVIRFAWRFRGVIIAIVAAMALYHGVLMAAVLYTKLFAAGQGIAKGVLILKYLAVKNQTAALAKLKAGTIAYNAAQKAFAIKTTIATAKQWLFNIAMKANPIGLIIAAVGVLIGLLALLARNWDRVTQAIRNNGEKALAIITIFAGPFGLIISMIREVFNNWDRVTEVFKDGGILAAIKQIGRTLLSGILAPIQGLLEILSNIPGLGHLAGRGADAIAGIRNSLLGEGSDITANTRPRRQAEREAAIEPVTVEYDLSAYERAIRSLDTPHLDFGDFDMPNFDMPDLGMGGPRIRGVVDISGGATATRTPKFSRANTPGTFAQNQPAAPAVSVQEAIRAAAYGINNTLREILAINTAIKTTTLALSAQQAIDTGRIERERAENENPRSIPPITREERIAHTIQEHRETLAIEVAAAQGTQARIVRAPKSPNIQLLHSGGNA